MGVAGHTRAGASALWGSGEIMSVGFTVSREACKMQLPRLHPRSSNCASGGLRDLAMNNCHRWL